MTIIKLTKSTEITINIGTTHKISEHPFEHISGRYLNTLNLLSQTQIFVRLCLHLVFYFDFSVGCNDIKKILMIKLSEVFNVNFLMH